MRITAITNQKGGVGKTTIALQLGAALARAGQRVLVVDLDPQASATGIVYEHGGESELTLADTNLAHGHSPFSEAIRTVERWGFDIAISDIRLAGAEQSRPAGAERRLAKALAQLEDQYDHVLIDCPPSLGNLTLYALSAADSVLIVTLPTFASLQGIGMLFDTINTVQEAYNPTLAIVGVVANVVTKTKQGQHHTADLWDTFGDGEYVRLQIPQRTSLQKAETEGDPSRIGSELIATFDHLAEQITEARNVVTA